MPNFVVRIITIGLPFLPPSLTITYFLPYILSFCIHTEFIQADIPLFFIRIVCIYEEYTHPEETDKTTP